MKKFLILLGVLLTLCSTVFANDITDANLLTECRIGPVGLKVRYDAAVLQRVFGNMTEPPIHKWVSYADGYNFTGLTYEGARVGLYDGIISVVGVTVPRSANGIVLGTPRGIVVGHDLDTVLRLYGEPYSTRTSTEQDGHKRDYYTYGSYTEGLVFGINHDTKLVEYIGINLPSD